MDKETLVKEAFEYLEKIEEILNRIDKSLETNHIA